MLQKEVTAALGMAEQHFGDLLNRQTNTILETIEAVADVLEVSLGSSIDRPAKKKTAAT